MPSCSRWGRARASGSPGSSTSSKPEPGGTAFDQRAGRAFFEHLRSSRGDDLSCPHALNVLRNAQDAVRVVSGQVIVDQHVRHLNGQIIRGSRRPEDRRGYLVQNVLLQSGHDQ
jgi:hypothetical protein